MKNLLLVLLLSVVILSHSNTAFADDGLTPGPGLFSGPTGEISLSKLWQEKARQNFDLNEDGKNDDSPLSEFEIGSKNTQSASSRVMQSGQVEDEDYRLYKEWIELNQRNPGLYNDFNEWLEYKKSKANP